MLLATLVLAGLLAWAVHLWHVSKKFKTIPGELGFPIIGNLFKCIMNCWFTTLPVFHKYLEKTLNKHGDICCFWFYGRAMVAVSDPRTAEKLGVHPSLRDKPEMIFMWMGWFLNNTFTYGPSDKEWKLRRKNLSLRKLNVQSYHASFVKSSNKLVKLFSTKSGQSNCFGETMLFAIDTVFATHLGLSFDAFNEPALFDNFHFNSTIMASTMTNPILGLLVIATSEYIYYPKQQSLFEEKVLGELMKKVKNLNTDKDMKKIPVGVLNMLRNIDKTSSLRETKRQLNETIHTGAHTVGIAASTALVFLATNPHVQEKAWNEQREIFADSGSDPTYDDLTKMDYLERCIKEVLRFVSPPLISKESTQDLSLDGMFIPANTIVIFNLRRMRFNSKYWDNPKAFDPDRFLDKNFSRVPKSACSFFGYGIRSCPGAQYSIYCLKVVLSTIIRNFKLNSTIKFSEIKYKQLLMPEIVGGYNISLERRSKKIPINL